MPSRPLPSISLKKNTKKPSIISIDGQTPQASNPSASSSLFEIQDPSGKRVGSVAIVDVKGGPGEPTYRYISNIQIIDTERGKGYGPATYDKILKSLPEGVGLRTQGELSPDAQRVWNKMVADGVARVTSKPNQTLTYETIRTGSQALGGDAVVAAERRGLLATTITITRKSVTGALIKGAGPIATVAGFLVSADDLDSDNTRVVNGRRQHYQIINGKPTWVDDGPYNPRWAGPTIANSGRPPKGWLPGGDKDQAIGTSWLRKGNKVLKSTSYVDPHTGTVRLKDENGVVYETEKPPEVKLGTTQTTNRANKRVQANIELEPTGKVELKGANGAVYQTFKDRPTAAKDLLAQSQKDQPSGSKITIDNGPSTSAIAIPSTRSVTDVPESVVDTFIGDPSAHGSCFPAGTMVSTPDGDRPIEAMKLGDAVNTWDPETKQISETKVTDTLAHHHRETLVVTTEVTVVITTPEHPFWTGSEWLPAKKLVPEQSSIMNLSGKLEKVRSVKAGQKQNVYNFHVASPAHNYFVEGLLVHNMKMIP